MNSDDFLRNNFQVRRGRRMRCMSPRFRHSPPDLDSETGWIITALHPIFPVGEDVRHWA